MPLSVDAERFLALLETFSDPSTNLTVQETRDLLRCKELVKEFMNERGTTHAHSAWRVPGRSTIKMMGRL